MTVIVESADPAAARLAVLAVCWMIEASCHGPCWPDTVVVRPVNRQEVLL